MVIVRILIFLIFWSIYPDLFSRLKKSFMSISSFIYRNLKYPLRQIYRVLNPRKASRFVWHDLLDYHKNASWNFGQFEHEKNIRCLFTITDSHSLNFNYTVEQHSLTFSSILLSSFDEERTNDVMVLASHFNSMLNYGVVRVNLHYNYVEYVVSGDLLLFSLYPSRIKNYTDMHYGLTKDCYWAFTKMMVTGDDPVFIFSELMRSKENNTTTDAQDEN